jgi:hypothetical protein
VELADLGEGGLVVVDWLLIVDCWLFFPCSDYLTINNQQSTINNQQSPTNNQQSTS